MPDTTTSSRDAAEDAITLEIVRSAVTVAAEEASIVVVRAAYSMFIQEGADACAALLDADGRLVAQSTATTLMHGASLRASLPSLVEDHPLDTMRPGDVFVMNDPYRGGIHANDLIVFRPVFGADGVCYFGGTLIHVADLGGVSVGGLAALATDTFAEGLLLPPVRLYSAGEPDTTVTRILERNSRAPTKVMGDVRALVAGANVLARRTEELLVRYGEAGLRELVGRLMGQAETRMRDELRAIPPGTYHGSFVVDNDGL